MAPSKPVGYLSRNEALDRHTGMNTYRIGRLGGGLLLLCAFLVVGGCGVQEPGIGVLREIDRNRDRWEAQGVDSYRYAVERICFCGLDGPVRVTVVDGEATERRYVTSGDPVPEPQGELYPTVDGLFAILFEAVQRGAFEIDVTYDPDTGIPLDIFIDYEQNTADEELGFCVTELPGPVSFLAGS